MKPPTPHTTETACRALLGPTEEERRLRRAVWRLRLLVGVAWGVAGAGWGVVVWRALK